MSLPWLFFTRLGIRRKVVLNFFGKAKIVLYLKFVQKTGLIKNNKGKELSGSTLLVKEKK